MSDDDETTAVGSQDDVAIRAAADAIGGAARACEETLRLVLTVPSDHKDSVLRSCELQLGELGDICHDFRRAIMRARRGFRV